MNTTEAADAARRDYISALTAAYAEAIAALDAARADASAAFNYVVAAYTDGAEDALDAHAAYDVAYADARDARQLAEGAVG